MSTRERRGSSRWHALGRSDETGDRGELAKQTQTEKRNDFNASARVPDWSRNPGEATGELAKQTQPE
jgi:hypothetical protein